MAKKLKLNPVQNHRIASGYSDLTAVLNEVKRGSLDGEALKAMKTLETAVQYLEAFRAQVG